MTTEEMRQKLISKEGITQREKRVIGEADENRVKALYKELILSKKLPERFTDNFLF